MERERDAKNRDDTNVEEDAAAVEKRLAAGALGVLQQIICESPRGGRGRREGLEPLRAQINRKVVRVLSQILSYRSFYLSQLYVRRLCLQMRSSRCCLL